MEGSYRDEAYNEVMRNLEVGISCLRDQVFESLRSFNIRLLRLERKKVNDDEFMCITSEQFEKLYKLDEFIALDYYEDKRDIYLRENEVGKIGNLRFLIKNG